MVRAFSDQLHAQSADPNPQQPPPNAANTGANPGSDLDAVRAASPVALVTPVTPTESVNSLLTKAIARTHRRSRSANSALNYDAATATITNVLTSALHRLPMASSAGRGASLATPPPKETESSSNDSSLSGAQTTHGMPTTSTANTPALNVTKHSPYDATPSYVAPAPAPVPATPATPATPRVNALFSVFPPRTPGASPGRAEHALAATPGLALEVAAAAASPRPRYSPRKRFAPAHADDPETPPFAHHGISLDMAAAAASPRRNAPQTPGNSSRAHHFASPRLKSARKPAPLLGGTLAPLSPASAKPAQGLVLETSDGHAVLSPSKNTFGLGLGIPTKQEDDLLPSRNSTEDIQIASLQPLPAFPTPEQIGELPKEALQTALASAISAAEAQSRQASQFRSQAVQLLVQNQLGAIDRGASAQRHEVEAAIAQRELAALIAEVAGIEDASIDVEALRQRLRRARQRQRDAEALLEARSREIQNLRSQLDLLRLNSPRGPVAQPLIYQSPMGPGRANPLPPSLHNQSTAPPPLFHTQPLFEQQLPPHSALASSATPAIDPSASAATATGNTNAPAGQTLTSLEMLATQVLAGEIRPSSSSSAVPKRSVSSSSTITAKSES